jgi:hypothetical protein
VSDHDALRAGALRVLAASSGVEWPRTPVRSGQGRVASMISRSVAGDVYDLLRPAGVQRQTTSPLSQAPIRTAKVSTKWGPDGSSPISPI